MTPLGDYRYEMDAHRQIDDATVEKLLTGGSVDSEFEALVPVVEAYRRLARQPVAPRGELSTRMATGVFTSHAGRHPVVGNHRRGRAVAYGAKWRRARMALITGITAAAAKLAGLSVAAKATAGVTIAAASIGTAGAIGVLPDKMQDGFNTVVEVVVPDQTTATPDENAEFGQRVSEDARDGGVDGGEVSDEARQLGEQHRPGHVPAPADGVPAELPDPAAGEGEDGPAPIDLPVPAPPTPPVSQP
jgi:hypothetical protein